MNGLMTLWTRLESSLWFVPGVMIAGSLVLAFGLVELDSRIRREWLLRYPMVFGVGTDGSRGMLTAIASSMLTVAALAFSLTLNAVTQASGQFTPRIFRNFLRDRANQFVLGYFVSVFAYCLVVLRTIRSADEGEGFVPSLAVVTGLVLALGGVFVLIFFIHHIATSLQINHIIDNVVDETKAAVDSLYPSKLGEPAGELDSEELDLSDFQGLRWDTVRAPAHGFIQQVDTEGMTEFAEEFSAVVRLRAYVGQFVGTGTPLADISLSNGKRLLSAESERFTELFVIERNRTIDQDAGYGIRQIVDIALKALSPGINDTTTAVNCIDNLGEIIGDLAERRFPDRSRRADGWALIIARAPRFDDYVEAAFDQIRTSGNGNEAVFIRLAKACAFAAERTKDPSRRSSLIRQIELTAQFAKQTLPTDYEKEKVAALIAEARARLAQENAFV